MLDEAHFQDVVERGLLSAKTSIWISTANIKDVRIESPIGSAARARGKYRSLFEWLMSQSNEGLDVRVLHAACPSRILAANQAWQKGAVIRRNCPRVHLKMVAVDGRYLYLGSANFTGAGLGAKSDGRRNFEAGIATDDPWMLDELQRVFDDTWSGRRCLGCKLRRLCPAPIDGIGRSPKPSPYRTKPKDFSRDPAPVRRTKPKDFSRDPAPVRRTQPRPSKDGVPMRRTKM